MGLEPLKLKLLHTSLRRRVILRALVIVFAFSLVSVLRNLNGAYQGETHHNNHLRKVDDCAVNFAFLGPFLFSGNNGLHSNTFIKPVWNYLESEKCKRNINLATQVVTELKGLNLLSNDAKTLCIGMRSVSALLAINLQGFSDARVAYTPPVFAFKHRKFTSCKYSLQYEDASFGFVLSTDVVETVSASLVYEIERVLKPGGTGAMLLVGSDSNGLVRSVSPVSSLLKNSSVVHVGSLGEQVLVVFRRNNEESFGLDQTHLHLPNDCSSVVNNRPYIGLLEPLLEEKRSDFERRIHYLPEFIDISPRKRLVYIDIGAADNHLTPRSDWFFPSYPIDKKAFNSYFVHHNTSILTSYVKSPGVTFVYHPGLSGAVASHGDEEQEEEPFVEDDSFDFLAWFKETVSFADFVVLKMNTSDAELKFLSELVKTGAICSVDELFLHCTGYGDCMSVIKSLRNSGVFVHQWWGD